LVNEQAAHRETKERLGATQRELESRRVSQAQQSREFDKWRDVLDKHRVGTPDHLDAKLRVLEREQTRKPEMLELEEIEEIQGALEGSAEGVEGGLKKLREAMGSLAEYLRGRAKGRDLSKRARRGSNIPENPSAPNLHDSDWGAKKPGPVRMQAPVSDRAPLQADKNHRP
jgi:hypothetical protein